MQEAVRTVLALLLLIGVAGAVPLVDGVRQARAVAWSAVRGAVQLLTVGLVLGAVFRAPLAVLPVLAVMVAAATATVTPRLSELPVRRRWWRPLAVGGAVACGAAVTAGVVFATGALDLDVRNMVALGGIPVGGPFPAGRAGRPAGRRERRRGGAVAAAGRRAGPAGGRRPGVTAPGPERPPDRSTRPLAAMRQLEGVASLLRRSALEPSGALCCGSAAAAGSLQARRPCRPPRNGSSGSSTTGMTTLRRGGRGAVQGRTLTAHSIQTTATKMVNSEGDAMLQSLAEYSKEPLPA